MAIVVLTSGLPRGAIAYDRTISQPEKDGGRSRRRAAGPEGAPLHHAWAVAARPMCVEPVAGGSLGVWYHGVARILRYSI